MYREIAPLVKCVIAYEIDTERSVGRTTAELLADPGYSRTQILQLHELVFGSVRFLIDWWFNRFRVYSKQKCRTVTAWTNRHLSTDGWGGAGRLTVWRTSFVTDSGHGSTQTRAVCPRSTNNMGYVVWMVSIFASLLILLHATSAKVYLNQWAVYIDGGKLVADRVAQTNGYTNLGQVRSKDIFNFSLLLRLSCIMYTQMHTSQQRVTSFLTC